MFAKSPATIGSTSAQKEPSPPPYNAAQEQSLGRLQQQAAAYQEAQKKGVHESTEAEAQKLAAAMREVGDSHSDPKVKSDWYSKAKRFVRGEKTDREGILNEIGGIVQLVMFVPRTIIGTASYIVGNTVRKVGLAVVGLGDSVVGRNRDSVIWRNTREGDERRGTTDFRE